MTLDSSTKAVAHGNHAVDSEDVPLSKIGRHLAHELNNPISAITSSAYLIQDILASSDGKIAKEDIRPFVESIQEECNALKTTVEEFTKFATTESILASHIDLSEFVRARAEEMAREGMPVTAQAPETKCFADADTAGLAFVLRALAKTAHEAGATQIQLLLSSGDVNQISLTDNRPERRSASELEQLFSAKWVSSRPRGSGLGLKLPLAKKIIELHDGSIEFPEQNAETRILLSLPKAHRHES